MKIYSLVIVNYVFEINMKEITKQKKKGGIFILCNLLTLEKQAFKKTSRMS